MTLSKHLDTNLVYTIKEYYCVLPQSRPRKVKSSEEIIYLGWIASYPSVSSWIHVSHEFIHTSAGWPNLQLDWKSLSDWCLVCLCPFSGSATTEISSPGDPSIPTAYSSIFFDVYFFAFDLFQRFNSLYRNIGPSWLFALHILSQNSELSLYSSVILWEELRFDWIVKCWYQIK